MTRFLLSTVAAAVILAAPMAAFAQATPPAAPAATAPAKPMATARPARMVRHRAMMHPARTTMARRAGPRDGGSAAVDALNDQALARARGTAQ